MFAFHRCRDAINRATDTFYPAEYEKIMVQHPLVARVQMVGVPDQRLYEEMCACVVLKEHKDLESKRTAIEKWYDEQWPPNADGLSRDIQYSWRSYLGQEQTNLIAER